MTLIIFLPHISQFAFADIQEYQNAFRRLYSNLQAYQQIFQQLFHTYLGKDNSRLVISRSYDITPNES